MIRIKPRFPHNLLDLVPAPPAELPPLTAAPSRRVARLPPTEANLAPLSGCSLSVETNGFCKLPKPTLPIMAV